jgi:hypothetical protein
MQIARIGLLAALLALVLSACSPAAQPPQQSEAASATPIEASTAGATDAGYPGPSTATPLPAGYPGPTAVPTDGPLVIPEPSSAEVGVISGRLLTVKADGSEEPVTRGVLYLGGLLADDSGVDAMVGVDKTSAPTAPVNSRGEFVFVDVPAGRYGLMFDDFISTVLLNDPETSSDFIIEVAGGESQSLGDLAYPLYGQQ